MKKALLVIIIALFFSCEGEEDRSPDCSAVLCPADQFYLTYRNTAGDTLIGTTYVRDSFKLSSPSRVIYIKPIPGNEGNLAIFYHQVETNLDYTLELSTTETDTLNFNFLTILSYCCFDSSMSELLFNDTSIPAESEDFYVLTKE
ncbi:MAG: hypothetical protein ACI9AT_002230 [Ulvibacter sp.]|jgi:hypothetical protein